MSVFEIALYLKFLVLKEVLTLLGVLSHEYLEGSDKISSESG
jgi:hypothetical protein